MTRYALSGARVLVGGALVEELAGVGANGRIAALVPDSALSADVERYDLRGGLLLPGFIDVQVNGGGGVLFNDAPTVDTIERIGAAHRQYGTTAFLPTLISDDLVTVERALAAIREALAAGVPGVVGIHVEGPFLSPARPGIHDPRFFRPLNGEAVALLSRPAAGRVLVTLAPEVSDRAAVRQLAAAGVIVSAGHTDASHAEIVSAFADGVTGVTHLFNAMSPLASRAPGAVGAALESEAWCGIIVDGAHVDPAVLRLALRCHRLDRFMLVTDAMPPVGTEADTFVLQGKTIRVEGSACYDCDGRLAGAALDMAAAVRNAVDLLGVDLATASAMASGNPAAFLGIADETGRIAAGLRADLVLLDEALEVRETWIGGVSDRATRREGHSW
jgi:N-acetylglucosamine-6-phosphate deacetylase